MTSIDSLSHGFQSPRAMMDSRISAAASAGSISSIDQDALESALDSIDSTLSTDRASGTKPSGDIKSRIDDLIGQQVTAGTLTEEQAAELKSFFAQGPEGTDGAGQVEGAMGPGGMGGPPPGPPPSDGTTSEDDADDGSSSVADEMSKQIDALMAFLETLRSSLSTGVYGDSSNSATAASSSNSGLVIDATA